MDGLGIGDAVVLQMYFLHIGMLRSGTENVRQDLSLRNGAYKAASAAMSMSIWDCRFMAKHGIALSRIIRQYAKGDCQSIIFGRLVSFGRVDARKKSVMIQREIR